MTQRSAVDVSATTEPGGATTLTISGTLDSSTYREVRDSVIKAALAEPPIVIVDVSGLRAPSDSAWTAFTSARWHVSTWPDVPVVLVCDHRAGREAIRRSGATRWVPVHPDTAAAATAVSAPHRLRRRATAQLAADRTSLGRTRELLAQWLIRWEHPDLINTAATVATVFVENVDVDGTVARNLCHDASMPGRTARGMSRTTRVRAERGTARRADPGAPRGRRGRWQPVPPASRVRPPAGRARPLARCRTGGAAR